MISQHEAYARDKEKKDKDKKKYTMHTENVQNVIHLATTWKYAKPIQNASSVAKGNKDPTYGHRVGYCHLEKEQKQMIT